MGVTHKTNALKVWYIPVTNNKLCFHVKRVSKDNYIKFVGREATLIAKINDDMEKCEKKTNRIIRICLKLACKLTVALKSVQPAFAST